MNYNESQLQSSPERLKQHCTVAADARLLDVIRQSSASGHSHVFVEDRHGMPIGVLSADDVLKRVTCPSPHEKQRWLDMSAEAALKCRLKLSADVLSPEHFSDGSAVAEPDNTLLATRVTANGQLVGLMTEDDVLVSWKAVQQTLSTSQGDGVTGLPNRTSFDHHLASECNRARRNGTSVAVVLVDLDFFKQINDEFGHAAGDAALKIVGTALRSSLRSYDLVARYGGDEFGVVCSGCRPNEIDIVVRRIRETVMSLHDQPEISQPLPSISVGAAVIFEVAGQGTEQLLVEEADECLYAAKKVGRNCGFKKELLGGGESPILVDDSYAEISRIEAILGGSVIEATSQVQTPTDQKVVLC